MRTTLAIAALLTITAGPALARCPGDFNLNETTTVDEIVAAVNAALNGCPAPVGCPFHFNEETDPEEDCFFVGRHHPICGPSNLEALFFSDTEDVIVSFFDPDIDFYGSVVEEGFAMMYAWEEITDPPSEPVEIDGEILLSDPPREALTVTPFEIPFTIDECNFEEYDGRFAEYISSVPVSARGSAATAARHAARRAASKARLRALSDDPTLSRLKREAAERRQRSTDSATTHRAATRGKPQVGVKPPSIRARKF